MSSAFARALIAELDDEALDALADRLTSRLAGKIDSAKPAQDGWLDTRDAAAYLGLTIAALHKLTAAREIPFEQDGPNCRCWFKRSELDAWRRGEWQRRKFRSAA